MIIDFNSETSRISSTVYDVAIAGGGPAGITLALALATTGQRVALLEGGGLAFEAVSEDMYEGVSTGETYYGIASRLRYLGGASNHWMGRCGSLDDIDFQSRSYRLLPGWPISRSEVYRFGAHAARVVDLKGFTFRPPSGRSLRSSNFRLAQFDLSPPTRFLSKYLAPLRRTPTLDCFLHANLTNIDANIAADRVNSFTVRNYNGHVAKLRARRFVVALGAIENARVLLNSNDVMKAGLGNLSDFVGRCFMEHLDVSIGRFISTNDGFWGRGPVDVSPSPELMLKHNINNGVLTLAPAASPQEFGRSAGLKRMLRHGACTFEATKVWGRKLYDFDCPGDSVITTMIEQVANPRSRITLTPERDTMGLHRISLAWHVDVRDLRSIEIMATELAKDFARQDIARIQIAPEVRNRTIRDFGLQSHHMGTTRMSRDARFGVVDADLKVHGIANLFMIGSSVFPTGGGINPTFTIVALTLRLAEHLKTKAA
jgi:choline dehydrogenase-like flavoprotein